MKKIILYAAAGIAVGYFFRKIQERADIKKICDNMTDLSDKTKKRLKDAFNNGANEVDYIKDQVENKIIK